MLPAGRFSRLSSLGFVLLALAALNAQSGGAKAEEVRDYDVLVRQKPVGKVSIHIKTNRDGTTVSTTDTSVEATFFFITYRYQFHGREIWQGDRFVQLDSRTNDDGKALAVTAVVDGNGSRVDVRGSAARRGPILTMTSNYWRAPDPRTTAAQFSIIDADTGALFAVKLQHLGAEAVSVEGQKITCEHCRVSGDTAAEVWFDEHGRLVRQETVEQGYVTELRLSRVRGNAAE
jgi:hypothetical protein